MKIEVKNREIKVEISGGVDDFKPLFDVLDEIPHNYILFESGYEFAVEAAQCLGENKELIYEISDDASAHIIFEDNKIHFSGKKNELKFLWAQACRNNMEFRVAFFAFYIEIFKKQKSENEAKQEEIKKQMIETKISRFKIMAKMFYYKFVFPLTTLLSLLFLVPGTLICGFIFSLSVFLRLIPNEHVPHISDLKGFLKGQLYDRDKEIWDRLISISKHTSWCFWIIVVSYILFGEVA